MTAEQTRSLLTVCLMAAFADGHNDPREREHVRRTAEALSAQAGLDVMALYQDVLLKRVTLEQAVTGLDTLELKQLAFEMAVGVCDADGVHDAGETAFLDRLSELLALGRRESAAIIRDADALADAPVNRPLPEAPPVAVPSIPAGPDQTELDRMILNAAILNGALELLPESLASMAIIPLQTRLVYRVGKAHGFELDRGHITDFLATVGVGLTSQYVEQFGRKLVGGLLGKVLGRVGRTIGSEATGSAFSFATTYALGHVARRYYADGRRLDAAALKASFAQLLDNARGLQQRYAPEIAERARTLDLKKLTAELGR
ncbi:YcjF family protein [Aromatoleum diolicum]|uniref:GTPase n=1 Tax=Aromatoleum diolicum TaxID=75796 RepID=A0ABX1QDW0_9RHOO|nr:TerB family tellurite resistance protein [Aromatoleum diolicum]NMG75265.1 GTPase [Aromatoleum diolicum]